jgi:hypothetical protein
VRAEKVPDTQIECTSAATTGGSNNRIVPIWRSPLSSEKTPGSIAATIKERHDDGNSPSTFGQFPLRVDRKNNHKNSGEPHCSVFEAQNQVTGLAISE